MSSFIEMKAPALSYIAKAKQQHFHPGVVQGLLGQRQQISFPIQQLSNAVFLRKAAKGSCGSTELARLLTEAPALLLRCHDSVWRALAVLPLASEEMCWVMPIVLLTQLPFVCLPRIYSDMKISSFFFVVAHLFLIDKVFFIYLFK